MLQTPYSHHYLWGWIWLTAENVHAIKLVHIHGFWLFCCGTAICGQSSGQGWSVDQQRDLNICSMDIFRSFVGRGRHKMTAQTHLIYSYMYISYIFMSMQNIWKFWEQMKFIHIVFITRRKLLSTEKAMNGHNNEHWRYYTIACAMHLKIFACA